ncbi:hypothetical protein, partial [Marinobacter sp. NFXS9]|uniref:hypothetical protein n=1 Tax=Marinobacter sp. NFXS9 TaxID=2818433 RepID=UPI0032DEE401
PWDHGAFFRFLDETGRFMMDIIPRSQANSLPLFRFLLLQGRRIRTLSLDMGDWSVLKIPTSRPQFQWNAIGTANGSAGSLEICNPRSQKGARALIISFAGRVRTSLDYDHNGIDERSPGASIDCQ